MTQDNRPDLKDWEAQINDLLDGELSDQDAGALKGAAEQDQSLARAIIEAYQLQQALAQMPVEAAPASLRRKLSRIPKEQARAERGPGFTLRWAGALAAIPLAIVIAVTQLGPQEPSAAEIAQAEEDLRIALAYLGKVGRRTGLEIESQVSGGVNEAVTDTLFKTIDEQMPFDKEQEA